VRKIFIFALFNALLCNLSFFSQANSWPTHTDHRKTKFCENFSIRKFNNSIVNVPANAIRENKYSTTSFIYNPFSFSLGINFAHFIPTNSAKELNWDTPLLNLGGEILISYKLSKRTSLISGFNYQSGKIALTHVYYGDRTIFHEISIPVLVDYYALSLFKTNLHFKTI